VIPFVERTWSFWWMIAALVLLAGSTCFRLGQTMLPSRCRIRSAAQDFRAGGHIFGNAELFPNDKMQRAKVVRARPSRPQAKIDQLGRF